MMLIILIITIVVLAVSVVAVSFMDKKKPTAPLKKEKFEDTVALKKALSQYDFGHAAVHINCDYSMHGYIATFGPNDIAVLIVYPVANRVLVIRKQPDYGTYCAVSTYINDLDDRLWWDTFCIYHANGLTTQNTYCIPMHVFKDDVDALIDARLPSVLEL